MDQSKAYTITGAPRVVKDKVIIGNGGAEFGVRGYVSAYDVDSGKMMWRFYTVPGDPSLPFEDRLIEATELVQRRVVDIWQLVSKLAPILHDRSNRPLDDSIALTEIFASEQARLDLDAADAARMLRAFTFSLTHPMMAAEPRPAAEIVAVFLHGIIRNDGRA